MATKNYDEVSAILNADHAGAFPSNGIGRSKPRQGTLYIQASTKKEAAEKLQKFGYQWTKPSDLRVGMGDALDALDEAGFMASGDLFIVADYGRVVRVSMVDGQPVAKYFGTIERKPVFVLAEETDDHS